MAKKIKAKISPNPKSTSEKAKPPRKNKIIVKQEEEIKIETDENNNEATSTVEEPAEVAEEKVEETEPVTEEPTPEIETTEVAEENPVINIPPKPKDNRFKQF